ncbi:MAG: hypothetical protein ACOZQL_00835 [Myxococcota bacterium]
MSDQLKLDELWVGEGPTPEVALEGPTQEPKFDLLDGPHVLVRRIGDACAALDAEALRSVHHDFVSRYLAPPAAADARGWAAVIELLDSMESEVERAEAALLVAELPPPPFRRLSTAVLERAACELAATRPDACTLDGRPAGALAALAGNHRLATHLLSLACDAQPTRPSWWATLARSALLFEKEDLALRACCRALLLDPTTPLSAELDDFAPLSALLDEAEELTLEPPPAWVPVLADLLGRDALDDLALTVGDGARAQRCAAALRRYRREKASLDEHRRLDARRGLLQLAPELRERLRGL